MAASMFQLSSVVCQKPCRVRAIFVSEGPQMIKSCASAVGVLSAGHVLSVEPLGSVRGDCGRAYRFKLPVSHLDQPNVDD